MHAKSLGGRSPHSHMWLVGALGLLAGLVLMIYVPSLKAISATLILFAGFHMVGGFVFLASLYLTVGRRLLPRKSLPADGVLDFGWAPAWTAGPVLFAIIALASAVAIQAATPAWWPTSIVLALLAANAFAGYLIAASAAKPDHAALPMVDLMPDRDGLILDGGCGAGRTSIAVARALTCARIVALDRFDSDYIEAGGRALLERNLKAAGLSDRVRVEQGDLTHLPFDDESFDAAVSAHAIDHLGTAKETGLAEMFRVLKPGGRFLLVIWTPGWTMFAVANVLSFFLASKTSWRSMATRVGFIIPQEGSFNGVCFLLLAKPTKTGRDQA
jgi:ubiquinone/menaquinone biosynthesis C-methylase UbiE